MLLAQAASTPHPASSLKDIIVKDANLVAGALGWIALAVVVGWATKKILGWLSAKFTNSPIAGATIKSTGKSLQVLTPAYAIWLINESNAALFPDFYDAPIKLVISLLLSVAHTATAYHMVAIPIAWAKKVADDTDNKLDDVLVPMLSTVIKIVVILVGSVKAVSIVDPETSKSFLALLATGGLAVGLASQDTIKNIFGAAMLIIDQPFTLGDLINTGTHEGRVQSLGLRSTTLTLLDGQLLMIPNADLANRPIVNITRRDFIRAQDLVHLEVNTSAAKAQEAVQIIREIMTNHEGFDHRQPPLVHLHEFGEWAINIRIMYWYFPAAAVMQMEFNQKLLLQVVERLKAANINLAIQGTPQTRS
jgi:MscS family membrane protein